MGSLSTETIGEKEKFVRHLQRFSRRFNILQKDIAAILDEKPGNVSAWMRGHCRPELKKIPEFRKKMRAFLKAQLQAHAVEITPTLPGQMSIDELIDSGAYDPKAGEASDTMTVATGENRHPFFTLPILGVPTVDLKISGEGLNFEAKVTMKQAGEIIAFLNSK